MAVQTLIQVRRGTLAQWNASDDQALGEGILYQGEMGYETDTRRFKIGDGSTPWASLPYAAVIPTGFLAGSGICLTPGDNGSSVTISLCDPTIQVADITDFNEGVDDRVSTLLQAGTNISLSYDDNANTLTINSTLGTEAIQDTIGTYLVGVSGISVSYDDSTGYTTLSLSDPSIELADITNLTTEAENFLLNSTSSHLRALVTDETGSGQLVFSDSPSLSGIVTITGDLTVSGSGLVAGNINDFHTQVRTNRLDQMSAPTADVSLNSNKITNLAAPTADSDAATKAYVDAARSGLDVKSSVRVATTTNITLSGTQTIDNVSVLVGDRVLVKNQSTASENGIYVVSETSWSRATDANSDAEVTSGMFTFVSEGDTNADSGWVLTTNDTIVLGTTNLSFAQFSSAGQITAGDGLVKNGNSIDAVGTTGRIIVNSDNIDLATVTQNDSTGSAGLSFVQTVDRDAYGRVSGVITSTIQDASTSQKGIAQFDSGDFSAVNGVISIKISGVDNSQLVNNSITIGGSSIALGDTATSITGVTSFASTNLYGELTGNASSATKLQTPRTINGTNFDGTQNIVISFVDGGTP